MGLGFSYGGGGGDFVPVVRYDARAGRIFRDDKDEAGRTPHDITRNFKAVVDFENMEVGWLLFGAGVAPDFRMVPFGDVFPDRPSANHKQGIRLMLKLAGESAGQAAAIREIAGTSSAFLRGVDALHDAYVEGEKQNPGKLPVVIMKDTLPITSKGQGQSSTNYQPVFEIVGWVPRPKDLVFVPKTPAQRAAAPRPSAPATGSTQVAPPTSKPAPQPAMAGADEEDFG